MDDDAAPPEGAGPSDVSDDVTPPAVRPRWSGIAGEVPAAREGHTSAPGTGHTGADQPTEAGPTVETAEPAEPVDHGETGEASEPTQPVVTPWWSSAAGSTNADGAPLRAVPPPPVRAPSRASSSGALRPILIAALVGALVASLVTGLLFVAFRDNHNSSTGTTTPLAITGANARDLAPLPNGSSAMNIPAVLARVQSSVVRVSITTAGGAAAGTGIVIDPNGTIVTNAHVVDGATAIRVQLPDGDVAPGTVKGVDPTHDLAVITIPRHNLASAVLGDSDALAVGDPVIAVGNALDLGISVTTGIVSAIDRDVPEENGNTLLGALQTDAAINPGNSGGPLVNAQGQVIGINTAIAPPTDAANVGFAIAISAAKPIIADLADGRAPKDALLGVTSQDVTPQLVTQHHLKVDSGAYVDRVDPKTPAAKAGITQGDVVVSLDGRTVTSTEEMRRYIRRNQPGDKVQVVFVRPDGTRKTVTVTLSSN